MENSTSNDFNRSRKPNKNQKIPKDLGELKQLIATQNEKQLKKGLEKKFFDTVASGTVDNTGDIIDMSNVSQGDTGTTRDGDTINVVHVESKYTWFVDANSGGNTVRLMIFAWRMNDAQEAPTAARILNIATDPLSSINADALREKKIFIIHDQSYAISDLAPAVAHTSYQSKGYQNKIQFNFGATSGSFKLYAFAMSDAGSDPPVLRFYGRVVFLDA